LTVVLVVVGIIAAAALHWFMKNGRARHRRGGRAAGGKSEPALGAGLDARAEQDEIPLLDAPVAGFAPGGYAFRGEHSYSDGELRDGDGDRDFRDGDGDGDLRDGDGDVDAGDAVADGDSIVTGVDASVTDARQFRRRKIEGFDRLSQIDFWARISAGSPARDVGRETVLAMYHDAAAGLRHAHGMHGLKVAERAWRNLEFETEDSRFADLVVTLQLADRRGPVDAAEMTRFSNLVSKLSEGSGREFEFMTTTENALAQAAHLAEFISHFDSVFVVNVSPADADARFYGDAIDRLAPRLGLERDDNNHYARFKQVGKGRARLYGLADRSDSGRFDFHDLESFSTRGLVFFTKPALQRSPGAVFAEMVDTAKAFAARMHGVVDSPNSGRRGGRDLSQDDVESIRRAIEQVAADMVRAGIACGGSEATRLFA